MEWMVVSLNHILHLDRHGYGVECTLEVFDIYDHFVSLAFLSLFLCCNYAISQVAPLLNGQNDKSRDQRSGILHIVRDP